MSVLHWLNVELWTPLWPNMFAPSVSSLAAIGISHWRASRQRERHHEEIKQHITNVTGGGQ